jgi:hypothetical protein
MKLIFRMHGRQNTTLIYAKNIHATYSYYRINPDYKNIVKPIIFLNFS